MGIFQNLLLKVHSKLRPMFLIASLPQNNPELAQAALDGGADAVKFHINLDHHASGTHFGSLDEERPAIEKILRIWEGKPAGIVPGAASDLDPKMLAVLPDLGVDFISLYLKHAAVGTLPPIQKLDRMLALSYQDGPEIAEGLDHLPIQACELSIMHPDSYGQPLTYHDLARFAAVAKRTRLPLVAPTQHSFQPDAVEDLYAAGISALMIGAIVAGDTPEVWLKTVKSFRIAIDRLNLAAKWAG